MEEKTHSKSTEDVEKLLQDAIDEAEDGTSADCREVNFGISQTTGLSSLNYDELNDDTLLMASEWNLLTEDFADDEEEIIVVSTPLNDDNKKEEKSVSSFEDKNRVHLPVPQLRRPPIISSEDDETMLISSDSMNIAHQAPSSASAALYSNTGYSHLIPYNFRLDSEDYDEETTKGDDLENENVDEVEESRRYLTIHSAPLYRWSEGMLPSMATLQKQDELRLRDEEADLEGDHDDVDNDPEEEKKMLLESVQNGPSIPAFDKARDKVTPQLNSIRSPWIAERLRHLAKAYNDRTSFVKKELANFSDTDDTDSSDDSDAGGGNTTDAEEKKAIQERKRKEHFTFESIFGDEWEIQDRAKLLLDEKVETIRLEHQFRCCSSGSWIGRVATEVLVFFTRLRATLTGTVEPQSSLNVFWLFLLAIAFCYNATCILFRAVFPYERDSRTSFFFALDLFFDSLYILDVFWFKAHLRFVEAGQWIDDVAATKAHYHSQRCFRIDLAAALPVDLLLWAYLGDYHKSLPTLQRLSRLNRLLKVDAFWAFFERIDALSTRQAYIFRIIHTLCYKMYIIHLGACCYYAVSDLQGFRTTPWTYDGEGNAYLRCFYFAFRTTTGIGGRLPKPTTPFERVYMTAAWLLGVFVFAMVIGQIRDIVSNAARDADHYRKVLDQTAAYMRRLNVPPYVQTRVRYWLNFTWDMQKTFNEEEILSVLPLKSRTDIALSVHLDTLARVELFKNIDRNVLRDLVLKLRPILFLPDDYVCRRGDVGHEMYIVNKGRIQVLAGDGTVLITLGEGSVFGEIAILNLEGFTRRTADVRSVGYSQLFALTKADLWETLKNYPEYQAVLKRKVQKILRKKRAAQQQNPKHQQVTETKASRRRRTMKKQATFEEKEDLKKSLDKDRPEEIALQMPSVAECTTTAIPKVDIAPAGDDKTEHDKLENQVQIQLHYTEDEDDEEYDYDDDDDEVFDVAGTSIEVESILNHERPRTPKLFDAVMASVRPDSKVKGYFSRSQSIASTYIGQNSVSFDDDTNNTNTNTEEVKIKVDQDSQ